MRRSGCSMISPRPVDVGSRFGAALARNGAGRRSARIWVWFGGERPGEGARRSRVGINERQRSDDDEVGAADGEGGEAAQILGDRDVGAEEAVVRCRAAGGGRVDAGGVDADQTDAGLDQHRRQFLGDVGVAPIAVVAPPAIPAGAEQDKPARAEERAVGGERGGCDRLVVVQTGEIDHDPRPKPAGRGIGVDAYAVGEEVAGGVEMGAGMAAEREGSDVPREGVGPRLDPDRRVARKGGRAAAQSLGQVVDGAKDRAIVAKHRESFPALGCGASNRRGRSLVCEEWVMAWRRETEACVATWER